MADHHTTTTLDLVLAWALVGIPLLWGFFKTMGNAMALFQ
ncbi:MAG: MFS transporter small subunit [Cypionkella sp.]|jgi:hypothetical protein